MAVEVIARTDVAIVGAGIVGCFIARELSRAGLDVLIVDPNPPGMGVTAEGMGHLVVLDDSTTQLAFSEYSTRLWRDLAPSLPASAEYRATGTLWVAEESDLCAVEAKVSTMSASNVEAEAWDRKRLKREEPMLSPIVAGAVSVPGDAVVYAPSASAWAAEGVARLPLAAEAITGDGLFTNRGRIEATWVVIAAGNGSSSLVSGLGMRPRKGHLAITPRGFEVSKRQLVELGYMRSAHGTDEDSVAFNIQPRATGQALIGSSRQYGPLNRDIDRSILGRMLERARMFVPAIASWPILRTWTGFRPTVSDGLPRIGPLAGRSNVLVATGHEGLGITTATATAKLIAYHVAGRPCELDPAPFIPHGAAIA